MSQARSPPLATTVWGRDLLAGTFSSPPCFAHPIPSHPSFSATRRRGNMLFQRSLHHGSVSWLARCLFASAPRPCCLPHHHRLRAVDPGSLCLRPPAPHPICLMRSPHPCRLGPQTFPISQAGRQANSDMLLTCTHPCGILNRRISAAAKKSPGCLIGHTGTHMLYIRWRRNYLAHFHAAVHPRHRIAASSSRDNKEETSHWSGRHPRLFPIRETTLARMPPSSVSLRL